MTDFQAQAVVEAINRMFKGTFYDICTVRTCMNVTQATETEDFEALRLYHCMPFRSMSQQLKEQLFLKTIEAVANSEAFPAVRLVLPKDEMKQGLEVVSSPEEKPSFIKRVLGIGNKQ